MQTNIARHPLPSGLQSAPGLATPRDFFELLKPRVMSLVVFTGLVGMVLAPGILNPIIATASLLFIALGAGAAGALNMWYEADLDAMMRRTAKRPLPQGRIQRGEALGFGLFLSVFSVLALGVIANVVAAALLAFTIFFYAVIYSMWLKRWTPQNIVIGGAAGALPPVIGWAAATGSIGIEPMLMFLIIFFWTPPHFWALALVRSDEYARAGIPMLPVVAGERETRRQIVLYSMMLAPLGASPWLLGYTSAVFGAAAILAGLWFVVGALRLQRATQETLEAAAKSLFGYSLFYLAAVFALLLLDRGFALSVGRLSW